MNVILETERLILRTFTENDAALLLQLNSDPQVTRFTHDPMTDMEQARKVLDEVILPQYALYNYGRWAVHLKTNGEFIGWCGLKFLTDSQEVDLGYRFMKKTWGNGYATEAASGCLSYGFKTRNIQRIVGRALPENTASIRVLEKCGMQYVCEEWAHGLLHKTYHATNPTIQQ